MIKYLTGFTILLSSICVLVHLNTFFHFFQPSDKLLLIAGPFGVFILVYPTIFTLQRETVKLSKSDYKKVLRDIIPSWAISVGAVLLLYATGSTIYYFLFKHSSDPSLTNTGSAMDAKIRMATSLTLLLYSFVFGWLYACRRLKKYGHPLLDSQPDSE